MTICAGSRSISMGMSSRWRSTCCSLALAQHPLEEHALVGDVLIDDPQPLLVHRQDEGFAQLAQRPQRCQAMQRGAGPGFAALPPAPAPRNRPAERHGRWRRPCCLAAAPGRSAGAAGAKGSTPGDGDTAGAGQVKAIASLVLHRRARRRPSVGGWAFPAAPDLGRRELDGQPAPARRWDGR